MKIIIRRSRAQIIQWLILISVSLILGIASLYRGQIIPGSILTLCSLVSIYLFIKGFNDKKARIIIDDDGICATEFKGDKILWDEIKDATVVSHPRSGKVITLELYTTDERQVQSVSDNSQIPEERKGTGASSVRIMTLGLDKSPQIIFDEIMKRVNRAP